MPTFLNRVNCREKDPALHISLNITQTSIHVDRLNKHQNDCQQRDPGLRAALKMSNSKRSLLHYKIISLNPYWSSGKEEISQALLELTIQFFLSGSVNCCPTNEEEFKYT